MELRRYPGNPILKPVPNHPWESKMVFNAGVIYEGGLVHIVYRAMGRDNVSRLGYACSEDGFTIKERLPRPIFTPRLSTETRGCEDPRLTRIGSTIFMTYTAYDGKIPQIGITSIRLDDFLNRRWRWGRRIMAFPQVVNKDAVILPEKYNGMYVMYHRIHPHIWIAYSRNLRTWINNNIIMMPRKNSWDSLKVGAGAPPIKTKDGWLFIYHGVDENYVYRLGYAILDLRNPRRVIYRCKDPILEPEEEFEKVGAVPNVTFTCGAIVKDEKVYVYYGAADTVICVATAELSDFF